MIRQSRAHLAIADESYGEHLRFAGTVGLMALAAGLACLVHAFIPAFCQRTASRTIRLLGELFDDRARLGEIEQRSGQAMAFAVMMLIACGVAVALAVSPGLLFVRVAFAALAFAVPATLLLTSHDLDGDQELVPLPA